MTGAAAFGHGSGSAEIMRGLAIVTRRAGSVGPVHEEQKKPAMRAIWEAADRAVPSDGKAGE